MSPAYEKIDEIKRISSFETTAQSISSYLLSTEPSIDSRLSIERHLARFQKENQQNWLFNLILRVWQLINEHNANDQTGEAGKDSTTD